MKKDTSKTTKISSIPALKASAGPSGVAVVAPPAYGIENLDRAGTERTPSVPLQMKADEFAAGNDGENRFPRGPNHTGLPDALKSGVETLSGVLLDDVRVHTNSSKPAQLQALAYTQGTDIHVGPGQQRHLPHEAWHVVQQKQGRVQPTIQMKDTQINDDAGLEKEADLMGTKALNAAGTSSSIHTTHAHHISHPIQQKSVVQRLVINTGRESFPTEFTKESGWIVASDVDLAFQEGGYHQRVEELGTIDTSRRVGRTENIYLEGHGSPGKLGHVLPQAVATPLNQILPANYQGKIRSHSCSAGVVGDSGESGVGGLASRLNVDNVRVQGAAGTALNHAAYAEGGGSGTRAFKSGATHKAAIDAEIKSTRGPVDSAWRDYILNEKHGRIRYADYPDAAKKATEVSDQFYRDLEHNVETHLLPKGSTLSQSVSDTSFCFITTACVEVRNLPDDCVELTTLRAFRDEYIAKMPKGMEMIKVYYDNAPTIVEAINRRPDALEIYNELYDVVCECVRDVQEKKYHNAFRIYVEMVIKLRNRFTPATKIPAFFYLRFLSGSSR